MIYVVVVFLEGSAELGTPRGVFLEGSAELGTPRGVFLVRILYHNSNNPPPGAWGGLHTGSTAQKTNPRRKNPLKIH